jgi:xylulokinase
MQGQGLIVGIDIGTQSLRALLADKSGRTIKCVRRPTPVRQIAEYAAEYDPDALWAAVLALLKELAGHVPTGETVAGIACASIGESCVLVGSDGLPLAPALAWFDRRTEQDGEEVARRIGVERLFRITGYPPDPTLSLSKILWHRRAQPEIFARTRTILPISPWIAFRLSGVAAVDPSLAARTLCLDVGRCDWAREVLEEFGLNPSLLPPICPSGSALGPVLPEVLEYTGLPGQPVVAVGAQDHICGGFAAGVTRPGICLDSLGTAEALLATADHPPLTPDHRHLGYVQTTASLADTFYLVGSGLNRSGGAVEWACRTIGSGMPRDQLIAEELAVPPGSGGVVFVPHLASSSAPNPDVAASGAFLGLTDATDRGALFRSVLEGIAMEARLVSEALFALPGVGQPAELRVIGGGTRNSLLLDIKASVLGRPLIVCDEPEMAAVGAALLGGLAAGLWPDFATALAKAVLPTRKVLPRADWQQFYEALFGSVYSGVYRSLADVNQHLFAFRSRCS